MQAPVVSCLPPARTGRSLLLTGHPCRASTATIALTVEAKSHPYTAIGARLPKKQSAWDYLPCAPVLSALLHRPSALLIHPSHLPPKSTLARGLPHLRRPDLTMLCCGPIEALLRLCLESHHQSQVPRHRLHRSEKRPLPSPPAMTRMARAMSAFGDPARIHETRARKPQGRHHP